MTAAETGEHGVESNSRITALVGIVIFVALAIEAFTVLDVRTMLALHLFVGFVLVPLVCLKLSTTGYRFYHYYRGTAAYRKKGPPHPALRIGAPLVVLASVATLATGIITLAVGPAKGDTWLTLHQGCVLAMGALVGLHVLGHLIETWKLSSAELRSDPPVPGRGVRFSLVAGSLVVGLALGALSLSWGSDWKNRHHFRDRSGAAVVQP